jgi:hypothetical protein
MVRYQHMKAEKVAEPILPPRERIHACYACDPPLIGNRYELNKSRVREDTQERL